MNIIPNDSDAVTIAFMCDAYRNSEYSSTENYNLHKIMQDVLKAARRCLDDKELYPEEEE